MIDFRPNFFLFGKKGINSANHHSQKSVFPSRRSNLNASLCICSGKHGRPQNLFLFIAGPVSLKLYIILPVLTKRWVSLALKIQSGHDCLSSGTLDLLLMKTNNMCSSFISVSLFPLQSWQNEEVSVSGPKIPQALEKILQLKEIRQEQLTDPAGQYSCVFSETEH